jgi:hypothetical protein
MKSKKVRPSMGVKPTSLHPALIEQIDKELDLPRIADMLDGLDRLKDGLRKADDIPDKLLAALTALAWIEGSELGLKSKALKHLKEALDDIFRGHANWFFKPRPQKTKSGKKVYVRPHHTFDHRLCVRSFAIAVGTWGGKNKRRKNKSRRGGCQGFGQGRIQSPRRKSHRRDSHGVAQNPNPQIRRPMVRWRLLANT